MENKKSNKGLIVLIIFLIIIILGLSGYIVYDKFFDNKEVNTVEKKEKTKKEEKSILKDKNKEMVYKDDSYSYLEVPYININTKDGERLNNEIKEFVKDYKDTKDDTEDFMVSYKNFENDNVVSIIIKKTTPSSSTNYYKSINIDSKTGKELTNSELLKTKKIDESELSSKLFAVFENQAKEDGLIDSYKTMHTYEDEFTSIYDGTKNKIDNNKLEDYEMYLNSNGDLVVVVEVYFIAGPEKGNKLFNLNTNLYEK